MRNRSWPVFLVGLGSLLLLLLVPGAVTLDRTERLTREFRAVQQAHQEREQALDELRGRLYLVSILIREFLLDSSPGNGAEYRDQLLGHQATITEQINRLSKRLGAEDTGPFQRLQNELDRYWAYVLPVLEWTPRERAERGTYFLRQQQRPRRQSILDLTAEINRLDEASYNRQMSALDQSQQQWRRDLRWAIGLAFLAGLAVAAASVWRIRRLERRAERQQQDMRDLSAQLVQAQEEERKHLSRELHDEVGQLLTGLRLELGALRHSAGSGFRTHLDEAIQLTEQALRSVRDLAMGLRPSMLDDLGLAPALQWQAREFSRRSGTPVVVKVEGSLDHLPDRHRTCIFRLVQEALTNCARHARAQHIEVAVQGAADRVLLAVRDDGVGFDPLDQTSHGLGLLGMRERVRELGGSVQIDSAPGKGMQLRANFPLGQAA